MATYRVGDKVLLKDNWLSDRGIVVTITKDDGDGYFYVMTEETSTILWTHESMFLPLPE